MEPWQERVQKEYVEVEERLEKLTAFLENPEAENLPMEDQRLLHMQLCAMHLYSDILKRRIDRF